MTSAEHQPADRSVREAIIRDLYALVAFYVANPGHPLPDSIQVFHSVPELPVLQDVAAQFNTPHGIYGEGPQTDHTIRNTSIPIHMIVSIPTGKGIEQ
jgi:hypothetical protein